MIKILVVDYDTLNGVSWWRNYIPLSRMRQAYPDFFDIRQTEKPTVSDIMHADIVLMFRPGSENAIRIAESVKKLSVASPKKLFVDIDDDLWNLPEYHHAFGTYRGQIDRMRQIYDMADSVWVSTEQLRYAIGDLRRTQVIQNAIMPNDLPEAPAPYSGVVCWRGSVSQITDLIKPDVVEWYQRAVKMYDRFLWWGYKPYYATDAKDKLIPYSDPVGYFSGLRTLGASLFWKPLDDVLFNKAKSNIAWIEATMAGGVCVTNFAGRDGWEWCLENFTTDPDEIAINWRASRDAILNDYNLETVNAKRAASLAAAVGREIPTQTVETMRL